MNIFFGKILFLPVMTKKIVKSKNIAVLPVAKPYFFNILLKKKRLKNRSSSHASLPVAKPYFFDILLKKGRKKP